MKKIALLVLISVSRPIHAQSLNPTQIQRLQFTLDSMRSANGIKGISASVYFPGMGAWKGTSGISSPGVPISTSMEFGIGSNTKLFAGVLLLKLAEQNLLSLSDSLHEFLPPFNNINPNITIRQLLHHTSGINDVSNVVGYADSILTDPTRLYAPAELMSWTGPPLFAAGTDWNYCNSNYILAGMIAESVTGQSFGTLLRTMILQPLQLDSTFLDVYETIPYPKAHPWQGGVDNYSVPRIALNSAAWAAGAMYSTSGDMIKWYRALMNTGFLSPASFQEMTTFIGLGSYGVGLSEATVSGRTVWQHGGSIWGGYNSFMMYDPSSGIIVSVLINQLPGQAIEFAAQLFDAAVDITLSLSPVSASESKVYAYPNPVASVVSVSMPEQKVKRIRAFNSLGQLCADEQNASLNMNGLAPGIYLLLVETTSGTFSVKATKE
jgi:D-alanyl-D-alanine carboxypeptidase